MNEVPETKPNTMCILNNGLILDIDLAEAPVVGQHISINHKSYRINECHESAHPRWLYVITLGY